jgi:hypothetical protein
MNKIKENAVEMSMWIKHTILVLIVIELFVAHILAGLYITNFKVEIVPTVKVLSPIN